MSNTYLAYDDLVEATTLMADHLLAAEDQVSDLGHKLAAAHGEMAALRGALQFERERARELRNRGDHWQVVATEVPPRLGPLPRLASPPAPHFFGLLRRAFA